MKQTAKEKELKKLKSIIKKWKQSLVGKLIPYERTFKSE